MKRFDTGRVQDKLINRMDRHEKQKAFQRARFLKFKLPEIHNKLSQVLLMEKIIETDNVTAVSDLLMKSLKQVLRASEFDFKYFIAPIRNIVPRPNPISLYITQYILEVVINDPSVIDIYGTDEEIYRVVNDIISRINMKFDKAEEEILQQLARSKKLTPGSRDYEIALDEYFKKRMGDPQA